MGWRAIHRWLGLVAGTLALVLGITGTVLALDPVQGAWSSAATPPGLTVAALAQRVTQNVPGVEEIRRQPSGEILAYAFADGQAQAVRIDPADGRVLGPYRASAVSRWFKNLHRSFLLGEGGRAAAALVALAMLGLSVSGLVLLLRRLGGWRQLSARVRGTRVEWLHVATGRVVLVLLLLSGLTALTLSAATFGLVTVDAGPEPELASTARAGSAPAAAQLPLLQSLRVADLRRLNFPDAADAEDTWKVTTAQGQGWIDRGTGATLAWQDATRAQRIQDLALLLHTGEGAWGWALVLGASAACIPLFWVTGVMLWWRTRGQRPLRSGQSSAAAAELLVFVASETGSTWAFAQALHSALVQAGHRVHSAGLEHFEQRVRAAGAARGIFVLAATYGDGQPPAHAATALAQIARTPAGAAPVTVLGFGDRQYPRFCGFAEDIEQALRARGFALRAPLARIHQQSPQEFARWGEELGQAMGQALQLDYRPRLPRTTALALVSRQDYPTAGDPAGEQPTAILRFALPAPGLWQRLRGAGLPSFVAGDLLGVLAPGASAPRYYSLASGRRDGFVELCVRRIPGGQCSGFLHALQPGEQIEAFVRANPGFTLAGERAPVVLIGAGTGVAPLAGFVRANLRRRPMHLYFGARNPQRDFYFGAEFERWLGERRLTRLRTVFSRQPEGGGEGGRYVQDVVHADAEPLRRLLADGASVRVCGSRPMAQAVAQTLDAILAPLRMSVAQLRASGRYAEDVF